MHFSQKKKVIWKNLKIYENKKMSEMLLSLFFTN